jgi:hypothetical protein
MAITITFTPTNADILRGGYLSLRNRPINFAFSVGFFIVLPWVAAGVGIVASVMGVSVPLIFIVILIALPPITVVTFARLMLSQVRGARGLQGPHNYEFSSDGILLRGPGFDNRVDWTLVTRCHGANEGLIFISGNAPLISVPGRVLSPAVKAELRELVASKEVTVTGPWKSDQQVQGES